MNRTADVAITALELRILAWPVLLGVLALFLLVFCAAHHHSNAKTVQLRSPRTPR